MAGPSAITTLTRFDGLWLAGVTLTGSDQVRPWG